MRGDETALALMKVAYARGGVRIAATGGGNLDALSGAPDSFDSLLAQHIEKHGAGELDASFFRAVASAKSREATVAKRFAEAAPSAVPLRKSSVGSVVAVSIPLTPMRAAYP